ncbi:MAG: LamG-like jellyroll fold domain-containing protein [Alphaproteobacteria bacterium]
MRGHFRFLFFFFASLALPVSVLSAQTLQPLGADEHTRLLLHLDEGRGSVVLDASRNGLQGELHGARWNVGRFGYGLAFDGSGVYLDVPNAPPLCPRKAVTVEAWLKLDRAGGDAVCKNMSYLMRIEGSLRAYFYIDGKWRILEGQTAIPLHKWTHVAMTYDIASRAMRTFINGQLDAERKLDGLKSYELGQSSSPLRIGRNTWRVTGGIVGKIDELRISDVARTFTPIAAREARRVAVFVPNGSFEFGRYGWRGTGERNSRLQWRLDNMTASRGRWSMRSVTPGGLSLISKPFQFEPGLAYVLSADLKADTDGRRVTLRFVETHLPRGTRGQSQGKSFTIGQRWRTVEIRIPNTSKFRSRLAYVAISKSDGVLWIDNVRLRRADAPGSADAQQDAFGVRFVTRRLGDTFFANTGPQPVDAAVVNASAQPHTLRVASRTVDFFGRVEAERDFGAFALAAYGSKPLLFRVDTNRRGPFRIEFTVTDTASGQTRTMAYRYNVIKPMKGVGDVARSPFGMNTHMEREPNEHLACNLEMLSQCGVKWIRAWWGWGMAEKQPGQFDWAEFDRQYELVTEKKMQIMPILLRYYPLYEHAWAGLVDTIQRPPYSLEQWGAFVRRTVARFKGRVHVWEIWNEPGYSKGFTPELYARLCKVTYAQARQADPQCELVGFAGVPLHFMDGAARAGAFGAMDIVGEHAYGQLAQPETMMPRRAQDVHALLKRYGKDMPIWATEQGTGADGDGYLAGLLTEEECASSLVRGYLCALAAGVKKFFWFSAQTSPTYGWAVFYEDYVPRPRLVALNSMASQLEGAKFHKRIDLGDNVVICVFEKGDGSVAVVWNVRRPAVVNVAPLPADVEVLDMMGNKFREMQAGDALRLSLSRQFPVYLHFAGAEAERAAAALSNARAEDAPLWDVSLSKGKGATVDVRLRNLTTRNLDALVRIACEPALKFEQPSRFVLEVAPGETRTVTFRYAPEAQTAARAVTFTIESGPFRLQTIKQRTKLEL